MDLPSTQADATLVKHKLLHVSFCSYISYYLVHHLVCEGWRALYYKQEESSNSLSLLDFSLKRELV